MGQVSSSPRPSIRPDLPKLSPPTSVLDQITLELYTEHAPKTCTNFYELAKRGYYSGELNAGGRAGVHQGRRLGTGAAGADRVGDGNAQGRCSTGSLTTSWFRVSPLSWMAEVGEEGRRGGVWG